MSTADRLLRRATIVLIASLAAGCSSSTVVSTPSTTPVVAASAPAATPAPKPTPVQSPAPRTLPDDSPVDPGTYMLGPSALRLTLRITFKVPGEGWESWSPYGVGKAGGGSVAMGILTVANLFADPCHRRRGELEPPVGPTVDDLTRALAKQPGIRATGPSDVTVSGFAGRFIELRLDPAIDFATCDDAFFSAGWITPDGDSVPVFGSQEVMRLWVLDVAGTRLAIWATSFPDAPTNDRAELAKLIDSIRIEP